MILLISLCSLVIISIVLVKIFKLELIVVKGNSMYPTYKSGQIVLIRKNCSRTKLNVGKMYIYYCPRGYLVIKRLIDVKHINGETVLWFEGDNKGVSEDSRTYGFVNFEFLEGQLVHSRKDMTKKK